MNRQHATPVLLSNGTATPLAPLGFAAGADAILEDDIQGFVHAHPGALPIAEIDPMFAGAVPICRELSTPAGPIDILFVTPSGLPVLFECKLWRNPEGRREVVGQILDYAKELSRWTSSDLQREVGRRLKREGNAVLDLVRQADPNVDEIAFNDALTSNLRRGRFLLLIVGDGIREGVEAIAEYLQRHAGLHFSLGLVELPIYVLPNGDRLVAPRVLARTVNVVRNVVGVPEGYVLVDEDDVAEIAPVDDDGYKQGRVEFWTDFLRYLHIDDPEQARPKPARRGFIEASFPAPRGSSWLTIFCDQKSSSLGVQLSSSRNSAGEFAMAAVADAWDEIKDELGGTAKVFEKEGRKTIADSKAFAGLDDPATRQPAFEWLAERTNTFINVVRPRVRSAVADYGTSAGE